MTFPSSWTLYMVKEYYTTESNSLMYISWQHTHTQTHFLQNKHKSKVIKSLYTKQRDWHLYTCLTEGWLHNLTKPKALWNPRVDTATLSVWMYLRCLMWLLWSRFRYQIELIGILTTSNLATPQTEQNPYFEEGQCNQFKSVQKGDFERNQCLHSIN